MATKRHLNADKQIKEINGQRWICEKINPNDKKNGDFLDNADGLIWRKIKPLKSFMTKKKDEYIPGTSQSLDGKIN